MPEVINEMLKYGGKESKGMFRAMTFSEAKALSYGDQIWFVANDGSARRIKVNGQPRTWKRDTSRIEVPAKYGMYEYAMFNERDIVGGRLLVEVS